jgi:hypothetical protein
MALCDTLIGIDGSCASNTGGVTKIYVAQFDLITGTTESNGSLTAIGVSGGTAPFYEFAFNRNTCNYTENGTISIENGSVYYEQVVQITIPRREAAKKVAIEKMTAGLQRLVVIVKDSNDLYWYFGLTDGAVVTANTGGSGTAKGDANNYVITLTAEEPAMAPEVTPGIIAALLA